MPVTWTAIIPYSFTFCMDTKEQYMDNETHDIKGDTREIKNRKKRFGMKVHGKRLAELLRNAINNKTSGANQDHK